MAPWARDNSSQKHFLWFVAQLDEKIKADQWYHADWHIFSGSFVPQGIKIVKAESEDIMACIFPPCKAKMSLTIWTIKVLESWAMEDLTHLELLPTHLSPVRNCCSSMTHLYSLMAMHTALVLCALLWWYMHCLLLYTLPSAVLLPCVNSPSFYLISLLWNSPLSYLILSTMPLPYYQMNYLTLILF